MNFSGISLQQSPPYFTTIKFFITAPLFLFICAILLIIGGDDLEVSNSFKSLSFIHAMTIGFMLFSMLGALQQMLPVLGGVSIKSTRLFSFVVYFLSLFGSLCVISGFFFYNTNLLFLGSLALLFSAIIFSIAIIYKLFKSSFFTPTIKGMIVSAIFLLLVVFFGVLLARMYGFGDVDFGLEILSRIHIRSAIFGWIFLLIVSVSYQVIPMFYVAPDYNKNISMYFIPIIVFALVLSIFAESFWVILQLLAIFYGGYTIYILKNRKRKNNIDTTIRYWLFAMICLILSCMIGIVDYFLSSSSYLMIVLFIFGFGGSVINGMLYKIVPFLTWFHLSASGNFKIPSIREIIKEKYMFAQFICYVLFVIFLALSIYLHYFIIAGALLFVSAFIQSISLYYAVYIYIKFRNVKP